VPADTASQKSTQTPAGLERRPEPARAIPDVDAMRRWLVSDAILAADGQVLSWSNGRHPGYAYPEAGGLLLSTLCAERGIDDLSASAADRIAGWLCTTMARDGGVGRGGVAYLFDSAVVLAGLLRYRACGGRVGGDDPIHRLRNFVRGRIAAGEAVLPRSAAADGRWSTQFGAHLVKCLHSLKLYSREFGEEVEAEFVETLINRSGMQPSPVYVHPFCYEQEGHLVVAYGGLSHLFEPIDGALNLLAVLQQADGGLLAFANGMDGFGEPRSDATAQAVRLWLVRDRRRYADAISRALAFLAGCQTPEGGLRYSPGSDDICSWATMFALQSMDWFHSEPRVDDLL